MKYAKIDVLAHTLTVIEAADPQEGQRLCGLKHNKVDHGIVYREPKEGGIAIVVDEYGLFVRPLDQRYFAIGRHLYAGNAMLYAFDADGDTTDFGAVEEDLVRKHLSWFADATEVARAIFAGEVDRPEMLLNGAKLWEWPNPPPEGVLS
jgi:hypothetical protein